ncbi:MAG: hypothetical protein U1F33_03585 [Alphaproteobacteria bacterium]
MPASHMSALEWIVVVALGGLMGMIGQGLRAVVGLKKLREDAHQAGKSFKTEFSPSTLLISLLVGFIGGALASLMIVKSADQVSAEMLVGLMGAGYAGTDFIEGFLARYMPGGGRAASAAGDVGGAPPPAVG